MKIKLHPAERSIQSAAVRDHFIEQNGELLVIQNFIRPDSRVFDVGACIGGWTQSVLDHFASRALEIHLFEPVPASYHTLLGNLSAAAAASSLVFNHAAVAGQEGTQWFFHYESASVLSTLHRRYEAEKAYGIPAPKSFPVRTITLDRYCSGKQIERIDFLKIDTEGGEFNVLRGAERLLASGGIEYVQFEYGGTYLDARTTLREVYEFLRRYRYEIYKIVPDGLIYLPQFDPSYEDYQYSNFLAVRQEISEALRQKGGHFA